MSPPKSAASAASPSSSLFSRMSRFCLMMYLVSPLTEILPSASRMRFDLDMTTVPVTSVRMSPHCPNGTFRTFRFPSFWVMVSLRTIRRMRLSMIVSSTSSVGYMSMALPQNAALTSRLVSFAVSNMSAVSAASHDMNDFAVSASSLNRVSVTASRMTFTSVVFCWRTAAMDGFSVTTHTWLSAHFRESHT